MKQIPDSFYKKAFWLAIMLAVGLACGTYMPNKNVVTMDVLDARDARMQASLDANSIELRKLDDTLGNLIGQLEGKKIVVRQ